MPKDIFNRESNVYGGSFAADAAILRFSLARGLNADPGLLIQNINFTYQQMANRIYEIGSNKIYYVGGRTQGQMTLAQVIGPKPLAIAFLKKYGDLCEPDNDLTLQFLQSCKTSPGSRDIMLTAKFGAVLITSVGGALAANDMIFTHQLNAMFSSLEYIV